MDYVIFCQSALQYVVNIQPLHMQAMGLHAYLFKKPTSKLNGTKTDTNVKELPWNDSAWTQLELFHLRTQIS